MVVEVIVIPCGSTLHGHSVVLLVEVEMMLGVLVLETVLVDLVFVDVVVFVVDIVVADIVVVTA